MLREGHYGLNSAVAALVIFALKSSVAPEVTIFVAAAIISTATLPDIDLRLPLVKHRGITHTIWFALIVGGALGAISPAIASYVELPLSEFTAIGLGLSAGFVGVCSHLLGDMLTPMGITPFSPLKDEKYRLGWVRASNKIANWALLLFGALALAFALNGLMGEMMTWGTYGNELVGMLLDGGMPLW